MIVVVMIVCITIIIKGIFSIHRNQKQLKELEQRLEQHYKEREYKLKSIKEFYEIGCGREGCKDTTPHVH
jgi:hypothetical protein